MENNNEILLEKYKELVNALTSKIGKYEVSLTDCELTINALLEQNKKLSLELEDALTERDELKNKLASNIYVEETKEEKKMFNKKIKKD